MFATKGMQVSKLRGLSDESRKTNKAKDPWMSRPSGEGLDMAKQTVTQNES